MQAARILVVEDDPSNRELVKDLLEGSGYKVFCTGDGLEAVHLTRSLLPDLVLMDIRLPRLSGLEATRMIKADPATSDTRVAVLSAFATEADESRAMDAGCVAFIAKPVRVPEFKRQIAGLVGAEKENASAGSKPPKVLVADDNRNNVELLEAYLSAAGYEVVVAYDGAQAIGMMETETEIDLIILDVMMPRISGYQVCERLKSREETRLVPIIMLTSLNGLSDKIKGLEAGADDFLNKPFNRPELLARVRTLIKTKRLNDNLATARNVILTLSLAVEAHDLYVKGHSERVAEYSYLLGAAVEGDDSFLERLVHSAILHDIGKLGVSQAVLQKPGRLSSVEFAAIKKHPALGENICEPLKFTSISLPFVRHHHERIDGHGYPDGLAGEEIPMGARIIAIADAYDAMISDRAYRRALSKEAAESTLRNGAGRQWDAELVDIFVRRVLRDQEG